MEDFLATILGNMVNLGLGIGDWSLRIFSSVLDLAEESARPSKEEVEKMRWQWKLEDKQYNKTAPPAKTP